MCNLANQIQTFEEIFSSNTIKTMAYWSAENATKAYLSTMKMVSILQYFLVTILSTNNSLIRDDLFNNQNVSVSLVIDLAI